MDNSKVEWTTHTFNPWIGCVKVSAGCKNCYAEAMDRRWKGGHWGPGSSRKPMSESYWKQPLKWDKAAAHAGVKAKVFCASMADWAEGRDTISSPDAYSVVFKARIRLFTLIYETPNLIWQMLTKRTHNILPVLMEVANAMPHAAVRQWLYEWIDGKPPVNVWIGTSVENQEAADERIPHLLQVPAVVRFLSCEPLLGPIALRRKAIDDKEIIQATLMGQLDEYSRPVQRGIDWVIAGGESGHGARPMHPDWVCSLRDQCKDADVSFFFKQHGEWLPFYDRDKDDPDWRNIPKESPSVTYINLAGGSGFHGDRVIYFKKVGKKAAGRLLDGVEHNEFPNI